jgi:hypothetical protein
VTFGNSEPNAKPRIVDHNSFVLLGRLQLPSNSIHLEVGSLEPLAWTAIAVLLALLGVSELLQLQQAITNFGRSIAFAEGWSWHRQGIQVAFSKIGFAITVLFSLGLFLSARRTSLECAIALACAVIIIGYIFVRAISLHQVDVLLLRSTFGLRWSRVPEFAGNIIILLSR